MSTIFYLVRHAKKEKGVGDVAISSEGVLQARATARHFRQFPIARIVSSPLKRAQETARFIAEETKATVTEDFRLRERSNWGDIPGQTFEEFVELWDRCTRDRDFSPPGCDSARSAGERLRSCLLEWSDSYPKERIVIVTHGGLVTDFLVNAIAEEELNRRHPYFIAKQSGLIAECSITEIACTDGRFVILDFASDAHLR